MSTNPNDPAYPTFEEFRTREPNETIGHYHGLTKREYFAALAMQGILANPDPEVQCTNIPTNALGFADALIAELNKEVEK